MIILLKKIKMVTAHLKATATAVLDIILLNNSYT